MRTQLQAIENIPKMEINKDKIQQLLSPEFMEWDGCILVRTENDLSDRGTQFTPNEYYQDRTGYEAFCNHIHLIDYFPEFEENPLQSLKLALKILEVWEIKLKKEFPKMKFHIILSHDEYGSVLRFHKYRSEEGTWLNVNNIKGYLEGVMLKEV